MQNPDSITAQSAFTEASLMQGMSTHLFYQNRFLYIYPIIGVVALLVGFVTWWLIDNVVLLSILLFPALILLMFVPYNRWLLRRNIRKLPNLNKKVAWQLDAAGINGQGEGFNFSQSWASMYETMQAPAGLLIYPQKNVFYWLPREAFATPADFDAAAALAREHLPRFRRVGPTPQENAT